MLKANACDKIVFTWDELRVFGKVALETFLFGTERNETMYMKDLLLAMYKTCYNIIRI